MSSQLQKFTNAAERIANEANVPVGIEVMDADTGDTYRRTTSGWTRTGISGAALVLSEQAPTPADGVALSATNASQIVALGNARQVIIAGVQATAASIRVDFGDSSVSASATTDVPVNVGKSVPTRIIAVPPGTTHMAYIRDSAEAADVPFSFVRA